MEKTKTAIFLGILIVGILGATVVTAFASDSAKANGDLGQMHNMCGKYMSSGTAHNFCGKYMNSGAMHSRQMYNWCNKYMNSGTFNSNKLNESEGQTF